VSCHSVLVCNGFIRSSFNVERWIRTGAVWIEGVEVQGFELFSISLFLSRYGGVSPLLLWWHPNEMICEESQRQRLNSSTVGVTKPWTRLHDAGGGVVIICELVDRVRGRRAKFDIYYSKEIKIDCPVNCLIWLQNINGCRSWRPPVSEASQNQLFV